jgi:hypothetical protein
MVIDFVSVLKMSLEQCGGKRKATAHSKRKKAHPAKKAA